MNLHDLHYSLITDDVIVAISNSGAVKVWTLSGVETRVGHYLDILKFCFIVALLFVVYKQSFAFCSCTIGGYRLFYKHIYSI